MAITRPANIQKPFAASGTKNTIPVASQIGITNGAASYTDGFPPLTFTPIAAGGVPPAGADFNGILNILSAHIAALNAGDLYYYDAALATAIGGYDQGALLLRTDNTGFWFNTTAANSTNPDTGGAGWVPAYNYGITAITGLTNANVTLTATQYSKPVITLAGTLTGNVNIIFPAFVQQWVVANNTTGNFTVTCKTASGSGVLLDRGASTALWGDGTNINPVNTGYAKLTDLLSRHGQCYLALSGANIVLSPRDGSSLAINGLIYNVPSAGVSLAPTGLTATTLYYIYAYMNAGVMTLEASTTGHSTDATTGVEIKTGDPTRTLVGMARPIAGPAWVNSATQRFVASWFNRRATTAINSLGSAASTSSTTLVELSSAARAEFLTWGDTDALLGAAVTATCSIANGNVLGAVWLDGASAGSGLIAVGNAGVTASSTQANVNTPMLGKRLSEGYHYVSPAGATNTGSTGSFFASFTTAQSTVMQ